MLEICVQSGDWYQENDPEGSFRYIHECGFEGVDYNINNHLLSRNIVDGSLTTFFDQSIEELLAYYKPVKEAAERNHVEISMMHAPFPLYVEEKEYVNAYLINAVDKCCAVCQYLGCPALVVHPSIHRDKATEKENNLQMYRKMMPSAKKYGVKLCLENTFRIDHGCIREGACADVAEVCWYIDTLNKEAGEEIFGFCLDTGHANVLGRDIREFIKTLGSRLTVLHIHDNPGDWDWHMIPYSVTGSKGVDWDGFIEGLIEVGYTGPLSFETFRGINALPDDTKMDGLKLVSAIGRSFWKRIVGRNSK